MMTVSLQTRTGVLMVWLESDQPRRCPQGLRPGGRELRRPALTEALGPAAKAGRNADPAVSLLLGQPMQDRGLQPLCRRERHRSNQS